MTSSAAVWIASDSRASRRPWRWFTRAAAFLMIACARITSIGIFSLPISKFWNERCVCAPQYLSEGTSIDPMLSFSVRVFGMAAIFHADATDGNRWSDGAQRGRPRWARYVGCGGGDERFARIAAVGLVHRRDGRRRDPADGGVGAGRP